MVRLTELTRQRHPPSSARRHLRHLFRSCPVQVAVIRKLPGVVRVPEDARAARGVLDDVSLRESLLPGPLLPLEVTEPDTSQASLR